MTKSIQKEVFKLMWDDLRQGRSGVSKGRFFVHTVVAALLWVPIILIIAVHFTTKNTFLACMALPISMMVPVLYLLSVCYFSTYSEIKSGLPVRRRTKVGRRNVGP